MKHLPRWTAALAIALAASAFMSVAAPTQASAYEYCRKDVTSAVTSCSFDTMEQCKAMSSGRGGDCFRDPFRPRLRAEAAPRQALRSSREDARRVTLSCLEYDPGKVRSGSPKTIRFNQDRECDGD
jgi:hypothetical protein